MKLLIVLIVTAVVVLGQDPTPCISPPQLHSRISQYNHAKNYERKFLLTYDEPNRRSVLFEEDINVIPGRQFYEYIVLHDDNVMYTINLNTKFCTRSTPGPYRPFGVRPNATFEDEYTIGGPSEEVFAREWSDRIPNRQREFWIGSFSMKNCYPIRDVVIANGNITDTVTTIFYDIVEGIPDPSVFVPPPECAQARYSGSAPWHYWR